MQDPASSIMVHMDMNHDTEHMQGSEQIPEGLTSAQVQERVDKGDVNVDAGVKTRSIKQIVVENVCTLFNAVNAILAVFVAFTGSYKNMLFMLVIVINTVIGIVQEIRSKRTTDALSIIAASKAEVVRDGKVEEIPLDKLVRDDVIRLGRGDQVPADCVIMSGSCKMNESLLTGESKLVPKSADEELMSGSFVNSGVVWARIIHVGAENYAAKIANEAKERKAINSEIMRTLNSIIKFVSIALFPIGALLLSRQIFLSHISMNDAILSTVSALVGMIPEGLILLTSTVLAVAVVRLSQSKVLVQQLYCIETLARVDVLCLDKTGTITTGSMEVSRIEEVKKGASQAKPAKGEGSAAEAAQAVDAKASALVERDAEPATAKANDPLSEASLAFASIAYADPDPNETALAIRERFAGDAASVWKPKRTIPFSSDTKWSGATFQGGTSYVMGAGQFVMGDAFAEVEAQQQELASDARVLLLARVEGFTQEGQIEGVPEPLAFICIQDQIRSTAAQTIAYFKEQGVTLKVISGDDPRTVSAIAQKVGVPGAQNYIDATELDSQEKIEKAIESHSVFGRVKPEQKKAFVLALQKAGHIVAMTGDGVNDTLALKASDCSVAMASGSDAARNVAQLVLVNNDFASMPKVVAEGRRSINNLQRSASLFLVKTLLSISLALLFLFLPWEYPFQPIQLTLISAFTIGLPSFVLALEPNHDLVRGRFITNVIYRSIPGAICDVALILATCILGYCWLGFNAEQISTLCVAFMSWIGMMLVVRLSIPYNPIRAALFIVSAGGLIGSMLLFKNLFALTPFTGPMWILLICGIVAGTVAFQILWKLLAYKK